MTEQELNVLERIWKGQTAWAEETAATLQTLADAGYIEIISPATESSTIQVQITDEGSAHLSGSGY